MGKEPKDRADHVYKVEICTLTSRPCLEFRIKPPSIFSYTLLVEHERLLFFLKSLACRKTPPDNKMHLRFGAVIFLNCVKVRYCT